MLLIFLIFQIRKIRTILFSSVLHLLVQTSNDVVYLLSTSLPKKESPLHRTRLTMSTVSFPFSFFSNTHEYIIDCEKSNQRFNRARHLYPAVPFLDPFFFLFPPTENFFVFARIHVSMHDPSIIFRSVYSIPLCRLS